MGVVQRPFAHGQHLCGPTLPRQGTLTSTLRTYILTVHIPLIIAYNHSSTQALHLKYVTKEEILRMPSNSADNWAWQVQAANEGKEIEGHTSCPRFPGRSSSALGEVRVGPLHSILQSHTEAGFKRTNIAHTLLLYCRFVAIPGQVKTCLACHHSQAAEGPLFVCHAKPHQLP